MLGHTSDPYTDLRPGAQGFVVRVELDRVDVRWDEGSSLSMLPTAGDLIEVVEKSAGPFEAAVEVWRDGCWCEATPAEANAGASRLEWGYSHDDEWDAHMVWLPRVLAARLDQYGILQATAGCTRFVVELP